MLLNLLSVLRQKKSSCSRAISHTRISSIYPFNPSAIIHPLSSRAKVVALIVVSKFPVTATSLLFKYSLTFPLSITIVSCDHLFKMSLNEASAVVLPFLIKIFPVPSSSMEKLSCLISFAADSSVGLIHIWNVAALQLFNSVIVNAEIFPVPSLLLIA